MKRLILTGILCFTTALPAWAAHANTTNGGQPHDRAYDRPGHEPIGKPGDGASATRTIKLTIKETASGYMLFEPDAIHIEHGSVVRFEITNSGALDHEFFLGSFDEIEEHKNWMRKHPDMTHEGANSVAIPSGESAELAWRFSSMTNMEFVCLFPGHREAGMWGVIIVHDHLALGSKG
jgi:uncharacterized cupredoxin-like copper-binding protein